MHCIFETVELVELICGHLEKPALLALATTSRYFQPSATKHLYRTLDTSGFDKLITQFARRSAVPSTIAADSLSSYAKLVYNLELRTPAVLVAGTNLILLSHRLLIVAARSASPPIFPSLRAISVNVEHTRDLILIISLLTGELPFLHTLKIDCPVVERGPEELGVLLELLPTRCPHLRNLDIDTFGIIYFKADISRFISTMIDKLGYLQRISLSNMNVDTEILRSLSRHPAVTSLAFRDVQRGLPASGATSFCDRLIGGIQQLRKVDLVMQAEYVASMLEGLPDTVEELLIRAWKDSVRRDGILEFAESIRRFPHLIRLEVDLCTARGDGNRNRVPIPMSVILNPVLSCPKLQVLRVDAEYEVDSPDDEDLKRLAGLCHDLRTLKLRWLLPLEQRITMDEWRAPTLVSLRALGDGCPHLSVIELSMLWDKIFVSPRGSMLPQALSLTISRLFARGPDQLAAVLAGTWPSVRLQVGRLSQHVLDGILAIRRHQASGLVAFDPENDALL